ncbi:hypothetical protein M408DRAFT_299966 [Serendipita vermifera MAFF 305830]|uniref:Uncharacterized protein n=1 Tax=Serendipita vermifera MAFF 305830 TaxID=933852 RepID=A0A0C2WWU4_SERVB|nr:hypothetical protein M408DRAFT_299966 [Serendipita vermifera MAFF 305830]
MPFTVVASSLPASTQAPTKLDGNFSAPSEYPEQPKAFPEMKLSLFAGTETSCDAHGLAQRLRGGGGICWCSWANMFTCGLCATKSDVAQERANPIPTKPTTRPNPATPGTTGQRLITGQSANTGQRAAAGQRGYGYVY